MDYLQYRELAAQYLPSHKSSINNVHEKPQNGDTAGEDLPPLEDDLTWTLIPLRNDHIKDEVAVQRILSGKTAWDTIQRDLGWKARGLAAESHESRAAASGRERPHQSLPERRSDLERDFTTPGIEGNLQCPFAQMNGPSSRHSGRLQASTRQQSGDLPTPPNGKESHTLVDPIEAEFHPGAFSSPPPSVTGSASKCPIRFLDQHSPEEVAKYFENHKHEIPRSHEICVKRYQSNAESIRQLDAKYGNLVSMIQGLGMKHQPLLPANDETVLLEEDLKHADRVGKWAEAISEKLEGHEERVVEDDHEDRDGHFDRPLKEIRVGESPSRPWGISVPAAGAPAIAPFTTSGARSGKELGSSERNSDRLPDPTSQGDTGRCPFGFDRKNSPQHAGTQPSAFLVPDPVTTPSQGSLKPDGKSGQQQAPSPPPMIFNGPVFIGYPAEQAILFLQQCGTSSKPNK